MTPAALAELTAQIAWNDQGLVTAIAQDVHNREVLMLAWMNAASLRETVESGVVVYWSRSRQQRWRKGDTSGHVQKLCSLSVDCDGDALLLLVEQVGAACHTGRRSCFYRQWQVDHWATVAPVIIDSLEAK